MVCLHMLSRSYTPRMIHIVDGLLLRFCLLGGSGGGRRGGSLKGHVSGLAVLGCPSTTRRLQVSTKLVVTASCVCRRAGVSCGLSRVTASFPLCLRLSPTSPVLPVPLSSGTWLRRRVTLPSFSLFPPPPRNRLSVVLLTYPPPACQAGSLLQPVRPVTFLVHTVVSTYWVKIYYQVCLECTCPIQNPIG